MTDRALVPVALAVCLAWLAAPMVQGADEKPIKALLVVGGCCHDYEKQKDILTQGISARAPVEWTVGYDPDPSTQHLNPIYSKADWSKGFDVVVHDECSALLEDRESLDRILAPHRRGLPAVNLHCAMHSYRVPSDDDWFKFTGLTTHTHGAQLPIALTFARPSDPAFALIIKGMTGWTTINEEQYHNEKVWDTVVPLVRGKQGNDDDLVAWVNRFGAAKVFSTTLGHHNATVSDPRYLDLVTRGLLWTLGKLDDRHVRPVATTAPAGTSDTSVDGVTLCWFDGKVKWGKVGTLRNGVETPWFKGATPPESTNASEGPYKFRGETVPGGSIYQWDGYASPGDFPIKAGDTLFVYVLLDPKDPPKEVLLQLRANNSYEHRAFWGTVNKVTHMEPPLAGPLPAAGKWIRLEVNPSVLGVGEKARR